VIVTTVPVGPEVGEKLAIAGRTVKLVVLVAVPPALVTVIGPVVAAVGTVAVRVWGDVTVAVVVCPLNLTVVLDVKCVPLIVTTVPVVPAVGVNEVIVGATLVTVKFVPLVTEPPDAVTLIGPVVAAVGTIAVSDVVEFTVTVVGTLLKKTATDPVKFVPVIVTDVPVGPLVGVNDVMVGAGMTVKFAALVAVPPNVVTEIFPVVAPVGTVDLT
jgi:hypothetical protein